ncbi:EPIDERMAL PATTERNING FACTOR-like protein 2 [Papaver somniferum]|uniref:EPIDERMAL PATTERNING FACTOR-like protein 2 n=1 Tax=Papaver somniferum TaxID=3469 RepID=UPI000E6FBA8F|nr:EPIDERMAL PATTERNING FACTOR-like protein 2 [Papaver somniferum]
MAASPSEKSNWLSTVSLAVLIFFLSRTFLLNELCADGLAYSSSGVAEVEERKLMVLGSRPPQCINKCFSCRPCTATLVIPPPNREAAKSIHDNLMESSPSPLISEQDVDDNEHYYLLSWKCRCGNKIYQP